MVDAVRLPSVLEEVRKCTPDELLDLVQEVMDMIPETKLTGIDVGRALLVQNAILTRLQNEVLESKDIPANQKAQVANAVGANLQKIAKMQSGQYTAERFKRIEIGLIELLNSWPRDQTVEFFEQYAKLSP